MFIASVVWLLFDMVALRMSINDVNSQLLKERVIRDREIYKESRASQYLRSELKHPVHKVDLPVTPAGNEPVSSGIKLAGGHRQGQIVGDNKQDPLPQGGDLLLKQDKSVDSNHNEVAPAKVPVNLDVNEPNLEKSEIRSIVSNIAELPPVVEDKKQAPLQDVEKNNIKAGAAVQNVVDKKDLKADVFVKDEVKTKTAVKVKVEVEEAHPLKTADLPLDKNVKGNAVGINKEEQSIGQITNSELKAPKEPSEPAIKIAEREDPATTKQTGVHKVLSLDVTRAPRDANAVGQFGQAGSVANDKEAEMEKRWGEGHFNVYLSDQIPVDRAVPDTRPEM